VIAGHRRRPPRIGLLLVGELEVGRSGEAHSQERLRWIGKEKFLEGFEDGSVCGREARRPSTGLSSSLEAAALVWHRIWGVWAPLFFEMAGITLKNSITSFKGHFTRKETQVKALTSGARADLSKEMLGDLNRRYE
jgi:hypothetical protein